MCARQNHYFEFPLGTLAAYGPDTSRATKLVAAVIPHADANPIALQRWFAHGGDIRHDPKVGEEIATFFKTHQTRRTLVGDAIVGCPHEEGIDYPLGETCPKCLFWAEIDRFTRLPKSPDEEHHLSGHISAEEILVALGERRGCPPRAALASADVRRDELTDPLLAAIEVALENPEGATAEEARLFAHALYLMAKWREPRAFAPVLRWLSLPGEGAFGVGGDIVTHDGARILAAVAGGDRAEVRALIESRVPNEYCRSAALDALGILYVSNTLPRETLVPFLHELIANKLERAPSFVWSNLACLAADLGFGELVDGLWQPYQLGWINEWVIPWEEIEQSAAAAANIELARFRQSHPPIEDVSTATTWWGEYHRDAPELSPRPMAGEPKIGRNDQCPCGSGKKYKKCCGKPS